MNWIDYKKLLNEEFKIAIELDNYDDKWMRDYNDNGCMIPRITGWRVNSGVPNFKVCSRRLTTAPQRPGPALQYLIRRDIHL